MATPSRLLSYDRGMHTGKSNRMSRPPDRIPSKLLTFLFNINHSLSVTSTVGQRFFSLAVLMPQSLQIRWNAFNRWPVKKMCRPCALSQAELPLCSPALGRKRTRSVSNRVHWNEDFFGSLPTTFLLPDLWSVSVHDNSRDSK